MAENEATSGTDKSNVETVKMSDGRVVDFAGKRKMLKESILGGSGEVSIRIDFRNGETRSIALNPTLMSKFAAHGAEQKYGDEVAGVEDVDDMVLAIDELHSRLEKGEWSTRAQGGGVSGTSVLVRALVEHTSKTVEQIRKFLEGKTQAQKIALRNNKSIKPIVDRIEAEKAAKASKVDTEQLLGELDAVA